MKLQFPNLTQLASHTIGFIMQHPKTVVHRMLLGTTVLVGFIACTTHPSSTLRSADNPVEFNNAKIILEQNFTDQDVEIVITVRGLDDGLEALKVLTADGSPILNLSAKPSSLGLGVRDFSIESPEPGLAEVLKAYPAGTYRFEGVSTNGVVLRSTAVLSHDLPGPTKITVDTEDWLIKWNDVLGTEHYIVELEREVEGEDEVKMTIEVLPNITSFPIPQPMRTVGEYQVAVGVVSRNGNITFAEKNFTVTKQ